MNSVLIAAAGFVVLLVMIGLRMPVALALALTGLGGIWTLNGWATAKFVLQTAPVQSLSDYTISVLPLFIMMGALTVRSGLSESLYRAAYGFLGHRRGGLAMASVVACAGFGAVCGSSVAAAATMTKLCVPEMLRYKYSPQLATGSVAAGGTLAILIPPSLLMIVYAFLTETSIGRLFAAGLVPGVIATAFYVGTIWLWASLRPDVGPAGERVSWHGRLMLLRDVWGVLVLFLLVMGGIFLGLFTATEGASVGAVGALAIGLLRRRIGWRGFVASVADTVRLSTMLLFVIVGVSFFNYFIESAGLPQTVVDFIAHHNFGPWTAMVGIIVLLLLLGCVMDSMAIVFITTPVLYPIVTKAGFDPVWFGVLMVMIVELGLITPPFGMNVFVIANVSQERTWTAFQGVIPFILADILRLGLLLAFPAIALWLPHLLYG